MTRAPHRQSAGLKVWDGRNALSRLVVACAAFVVMMGGCYAPCEAQAPLTSAVITLRSRADTTVVLARLRCQVGADSVRAKCAKPDTLRVYGAFIAVWLRLDSPLSVLDSAAAWAPEVTKIAPDPFTVRKPSQPPHGGVFRDAQYNRTMMQYDSLVAHRLLGQGVLVVPFDTGISPPTDLSVDFAWDMAYGGAAVADTLAGCDGHGDHVAGLTHSRLFGMAPLAWFGFYRVAVVGSCGAFGSTLDQSAFAAQDSAAAHHMAVLVNVSWGNVSMNSLYSGAGWNGIACVAAGNDGGAVEWPALEPLAFSFGAVGGDTNMTGWSSRPAKLDAPGDNLLSDAPCTGCVGGSGNATAFKSGTSMASPVGCASLADFRATAQTMSNDSVLLYAQRTALDRGTPGFDSTFGGGVIQPWSMVQACIADGVCPTATQPGTVPVVAPGTTATGCFTVSRTDHYDVLPVDSATGKVVPWITMTYSGAQACWRATPPLGTADITPWFTLREH